MRNLRFSRLSLQWKILLSTSVAITVLLAVTGWVFLSNAMYTTSQSLEAEVQTSFQAYQSLWQSRAAQLSSVSLILSGMSDVRAAFGTGDEATIRDTAGELWSRMAHENAMFQVTDPQGRVIASLGSGPTAAPREDAASVRALVGVALADWRRRNMPDAAVVPGDPEIYLKALEDETRQIRIKGLKTKRAEPYFFGIDEIYIPLTTLAGHEASRRGAVQDAVHNMEQQRIVLEQMLSLRLHLDPCGEGMAHCE